MTGSCRASGTSRGSAVKMPRTSVKIWQRSAAQRGGEGDRGRVAAATAERRDLLVVGRRVALWPWKPATMTTLPSSSSARTRRGSMPAMRARP